MKMNEECEKMRYKKIDFNDVLQRVSLNNQEKMDEQNKICLVICDMNECNINLLSLLYNTDSFCRLLNNYSRQEECLLIVFTNYTTTSFDKPKKCALLFEKGVLLGIQEEGAQLKDNMFTLFDTIVGRIAIFIEMDIYEKNLFYLAQAFDVECVIIKTCDSENLKENIDECSFETIVL